MINFVFIVDFRSLTYPKDMLFLCKFAYYSDLKIDLVAVTMWSTGHIRKFNFIHIFLLIAFWFANDGIFHTDLIAIGFVPFMVSFRWHHRFETLSRQQMKALSWLGNGM